MKSLLQAKFSLPPRRFVLYSYFEKGCRKKCMQQSQKVLWVALRSLLLKEIISKNGTRGHGCMFLNAKGKQQRSFYSVRNSVLIISHITFWDCRMHIFQITFHKIAVYTNGSSCAPLSKILGLVQVRTKKQVPQTQKSNSICLYSISLVIVWLYTYFHSFQHFSNLNGKACFTDEIYTWLVTCAKQGRYPSNPEVSGQGFRCRFANGLSQKLRSICGAN